MDWFQTVGKLPDNNRIVHVRGTLTAQATWNAEKQTWEVIENGKINCEVTHWKEIENVSAEGQST